jgi:hypothetical protein
VSQPSPGGESATGPESRAPSRAGTVPAGLFSAPAAPVDLTTTLDEQHATTARIGANGGKVVATGADGTTYVLVVPERALLFETTIIVTPLSSIGGLPGAPTPQNRAGVQLAPDGLKLIPPATLQIQPRAGVPDIGVSTASFHGTGSDVGLMLFAKDATGVTLRVNHFSGYGSFWPVNDEWWRVAQRLRQQQLEDRLSNQIAARLGQLRQQQLLGVTVDADMISIFLEFATVWDRDVLAPARALARNGCREATDAVLLYLSWERQIQLLGDDGKQLGRPIPPELMTLKRDLCFEEQFQRCRHTGDFQGFMAYFLSHFRQYEMFGGPPPDEDVELAQRYLERCGRWDLDVTSIWQFDHPAASAVQREEIVRHFKIKWRPGTAMYGLLFSHADGEADLEPTSLVTENPGCRIHIESPQTDVRAQAEILQLEFDHAPTPAPLMLNLRTSVGLLTYIEIADCGTQGSPGRYKNYDGGAYVAHELKLPPNASCVTDQECGAVLFTLDSGWRFDDGPFNEGPFSSKVLKYGFLENLPGEVNTGSIEAILKHTPAA